MHVIRWQDSTPPQEHHLRLHMQQEGLSPYTWSNGPNYFYAVHTHSYQKVLYCVCGSIRFILHGQSTRSGQDTFIDLSPGDCMILPAGIPHSAQVGPEGVTCLEAACSSDAQLANRLGQHIMKCMKGLDGDHAIAMQGTPAFKQVEGRLA